MRMLIGVEGSDTPTLLVRVSRFIDPKNFTFSVINGGWNGSVVDGRINVSGRRTEHQLKIFSNGEEFLNHHDYNEVFLKYEQMKKEHKSE
jgi:hypothetical protein